MKRKELSINMMIFELSSRNFIPTFFDLQCFPFDSFHLSSFWCLTESTQCLTLYLSKPASWSLFKYLFLHMAQINRNYRPQLITLRVKISPTNETAEWGSFQIIRDYVYISEEKRVKLPEGIDFWSGYQLLTAQISWFIYAREMFVIILLLDFAVTKRQS